MMIEALIRVLAHFLFAAAVLVSVFMIGGSLNSEKIVAAGSRSAITLLATAYAALTGMTTLCSPVS